MSGLSGHNTSHLLWFTLTLTLTLGLVQRILLMPMMSLFIRQVLTNLLHNPIDYCRISREQKRSG